MGKIELILETMVEGSITRNRKHRTQPNHEPVERTRVVQGRRMIVSVTGLLLDMIDPVVGIRVCCCRNSRESLLTLPPSILALLI